MRNVLPWRLIVVMVISIAAACTEEPELGEDEAEVRYCPDDDCPIPGDDPPEEDPPPSNLPFCQYTCSATSSCSLGCYDDSLGVEMTCGAYYGTCATCSASTCTSASCNKTCKDGTAFKSCAAWSFDTAGDADLDQVPDALELALAREFYPKLNLRNGQILDQTPIWGWAAPEGDWGQLYGGGDIAGVWGADWSFIVRPVNPYGDHSSVIDFHGHQSIVGPVHSCGSEALQCLEIVYVIPYNWDLGDNLPGTFFRIEEHRGDSEMYAVMVARRDPRISLDGAAVAPRWNVPWDTARLDAGAWTAYSDVAAAHMCAPLFAGSASDSSQTRMTMFKPDLDGPAELFVAEGKHASYFSRDACDAGGLEGSDSCDGSQFEVVYAEQFPGGGPLRNAGEPTCHAHPTLDPTTALPATSVGAHPGGTYHAWSGVRFGTSTPFASKLRPGTIHWLQQSNHNYTCWPDPVDENAPPPPPPPPPPPAPDCSGSGEYCCAWNGDQCEDCIDLDANQQCH